MESSFSHRPWNTIQANSFGAGQVSQSMFPSLGDASKNDGDLENPTNNLLPSDEAQQRLHNRQLRAQLQEMLLRQERGEAVGAQHAGATTQGWLSVFRHPKFFKIATSALVAAVVLKRQVFSAQHGTVENDSLSERGQSASDYSAIDEFLIYTAFAFSAVEPLHRMYKNYLTKLPKEEGCLTKAINNFMRDLETLFKREAARYNNDLPGAISPAFFQRDIRSLVNWIRKIQGTAEARVRPEHLADRLEALRLALFHDDDADTGLEAQENRSADRTELHSACFAIATAFDANCNDAAMEALEEMETAVKIGSLKRLSADRFLDEVRAMFKKGLLKEVAKEIGKWEHRIPGEELETYLELKSLLSEELDLGTQNKYMEFRTISRIKGEEAEYALDYVNKKNTEDDFIEFLSGRFRQTYDDFLRRQFPVFGQWREARAEWYADKLFEAGKQASEGKRIEEASSLINRKDEEEKQVMQDYARCLMSGNKSQLEDLERRLKKSLSSVELI